MHFMVCAAGEDLSYRFSDCGSDWNTGTFKQGIVSVELDVIRSGLVLDCLGCRFDTEHGPVWQINRDDMSAMTIIDVCRQICTGRKYTSMFDLTAMVTRAVCEALAYDRDKSRVEVVTTEIIRSFFANSTARRDP